MNMLLDSRLLRYVITLTEELHFGRAAAKLYVSQPALSEAIRGLERELGVELFNRASRHVEVTEAGKIFVAQARVLLEQAERSIALVRGVARGETGLLRVGYSPFIDLDWLQMVRSRLAHNPDIQPRVEFVSSQTAQQHQMLIQGQLQAGIVLAPIEDPALTVHGLFREPFLVAIARGHPFEGLDEITLAQLRGEEVISLPRHFNPPLYDRFFALCGAQGYVPKITREVTILHECLHFAGQGLGISFTTQAALAMASRHITLKRLAEETIHLETAIVYRSDNHSESLKRLVQFVRENLPISRQARTVMSKQQPAWFMKEGSVQAKRAALLDSQQKAHTNIPAS